jgi:hypothetical protein
MTIFRCDADIEAHTRRFMDLTLPKSQWTHAGHLAAALWLVSRPDIDAAREMPGMIRRYNEATGGANTDTAGYHETITQASLRAVRAWLADRPGQPLYESLDQLLQSPFGRPDWLLTYWSAPLLFSVAARRAWVEPDRQALPF